MTSLTCENKKKYNAMNTNQKWIHRENKYVATKLGVNLET